MIKFGFAKAYNKIYCKQLPLYQELNLKAKSKGLGLYSYVKKPLTEYQLFSYFFGTISTDLLPIWPQTT